MLAAAATMLVSCNPQPRHTAHLSRLLAPTPTPTGVPPLRIVGRGSAGKPVSITEQSGNRKIYELIAPSLESNSYAQGAAQAVFQKAAVTFYDKDGTTLHARAPVATVNEQSKKVFLSGGVHARTSTGLTLTCDQLTYDRATGLVHGEGNVRIDGLQGSSQEHLTGNRFTSDIKMTRIKMQ